MSDNYDVDEFIDEMREDDAFWDLHDRLEHGDEELEELIPEYVQAINSDPFFLYPYQDLAVIYFTLDEYEKGINLTVQAYEKALELILDKDGNWPTRLSFEWPENRHILFTLKAQAHSLWGNFDLDKAMEIYEKILRMDPIDELGVRFHYMAVLEGMTYENFSEKFESEGTRLNEEVVSWFERKSEKHKDEIGWWLEWADQQDGK